MTAERQGHDKRTRKREVLEPETGWANGAAAGQDLGADPPTTCPQPETRHSLSASGWRYNLILEPLFQSVPVTSVGKTGA